MTQQICPISGELMTPTFQAKIMSKYLVTYYYCQESGLIKTEKAFWLDEAYSSAIAATDTGIVQRNLIHSKLMTTILHLLFNGEGKFLDVSGGFGLLTRIMRDKGFDFYTTDKYCTNLFANYFEPDTEFKAKALCAFEVLEHIEDPKRFLMEIFDKYGCKTLIFSTLTFSNDQIPPNSWWYYSFETGQHITFYQPRTLSLLAKLLNLYYYEITSSIHIITDIKLSAIQKIILSNHRLLEIYGCLVRLMRRKITRTWTDHLLVNTIIKK